MPALHTHSPPGSFPGYFPFIFFPVFSIRELCRQAARLSRSLTIGGHAMCVLCTQRADMGKRAPEHRFRTGKISFGERIGPASTTITGRSPRTPNHRQLWDGKPRVRFHRGDGQPGCLLQRHTMGNHGPESHGSARVRGWPGRLKRIHQHSFSSHTRGDPGSESHGSAEARTAGLPGEPHSERSLDVR